MHASEGILHELTGIKWLYVRTIINLCSCDAVADRRSSASGPM